MLVVRDQLTPSRALAAAHRAKTARWPSHLGECGELELELELELILSQMAKKPMLRGLSVCVCVCMCNAHEVRRKKGRYGASAEVQGA